MVKFTQENNRFFLSSYSKDEKLDGLGFVVMQKGEDVEYSIAHFKDGKQDGFLFTTHGGRNFKLSLFAKDYVHNGPTFIRWNNAVEFVKLNKNSSVNEKGYAFFRSQAIQLDYNSARETERQVVLKNIKHDIDVTIESFGFVDFKDVTVTEEVKNTITLSNGVKIKKTRERTVLSIPEEGTDNLFEVSLSAKGEVIFIYTHGDEIYYPLLKIGKEDKNALPELIYKTRSNDYRMPLDLVYKDNFYITEYHENNEFLKHYEFNDLLRWLQTDEFVIGEDKLTNFYYVRRANTMKNKYFGMFTVERRGIGLLKAKKAEDGYYLGEFYKDAPYGVGLSFTKERRVFCAQNKNGKFNGPAVEFLSDALELKVFSEGREVGTSYFLYYDGRMGYGTYDNKGERIRHIYERFTHNFELDFTLETFLNAKFRSKRRMKDGVEYVGAKLAFTNNRVELDGLGFIDNAGEQMIGMFKNTKPYFGLVFNKDNKGYYLFNTYSIADQIKKPYFIIYPDLYTHDEDAPTIIFYVNDRNGSNRFSFELDRDGFLRIGQRSNVPNDYVASYYFEMFPKDGKYVFGRDDLTKYGHKSNMSDEQSKAKKTSEKVMSLDDLIGLLTIKEEVKRLEAYVLKNKDEPMNLHMVFSGNPGTGKTVVARIIADILYKHNILPTNKLIETDRSGLVDQYVGGTGPKTNKIVDEAMGGVLFIDEAYALFTSDGDNEFGREAIATLLTRMENDRGKFVVIMAGYSAEMTELINSNPGLKSRIQYEFHFPDYTNEELKAIAELFLKEKRYTIEDNALEIFVNGIDYQRDVPGFANAREVRKWVEGIIPIQNLRTKDNLSDRLISAEDVIEYVKKFNIPAHKKAQSVKKLPDKQTLIENIKTNVLKGTLTNDDIKNRVVALITDKGESTGFLITKDGYGVTCEHSVRDAREIKVKVMLNVDERKFTLDYNATVVKVDKENDVAIFKLETSDHDFYHLNLALENPEQRDEIYLPGFIWGYSFLPTITIYEGKIVNTTEKRYSIDIFGKSGQSGSPIISKTTNEVVGVFCGASSRHIGRTYQEINHFVPINYVWQLLDEVKDIK